MKKNFTLLTSYFLLLTSYGCPGESPITPIESPTPQTSASVTTPTVTASPLPTSTIIPATSTPSGTPVPFPTQTPTTVITPSPAPTPTPAQYATIAGTVWDIDQSIRLDNATVQIKSLSSTVLFDKTVKTDTAGGYTVTDIPLNVVLDIIAHAPGYTIRKQARTLTSSDKQTIDFKDTFGLSSKPEVIDISPAFAATDVDPATSITLTFDEGMDKASVEKAFAIFSDKENDSVLNVGVSIPGYQTGGFFAKPIYTTGAFKSVEWQDGDKKAIFTFRDGFYLPVDTGGTFSYRIILSYKNNIIKDANGIEGRQTIIGSTRDEGAFYINNAYRYYSLFTVKGNANPLNISQVTAYDTNKIRVEFTKRLFLTLDDNNTYVCGGSGGNDTSKAPAGTPNIGGTTAAQAANNYTLKVNGLNQAIASADFSLEDSTGKTVMLTTAAPFAAGNSLELNISSNIVDPSNNHVTGNNIYTFMAK